MPRNPTAVREVLEAILKTSRKKASPEVIEGIRARLAKEPSLEMTDDVLDALAEAESWRLEEAQSLLPFARKKFPYANFDDIEAILRKLETMRESDPQSVDVLLPETMERYWKRIDNLKLSQPHVKRLEELSKAVAGDMTVCRHGMLEALADWKKVLGRDEQVPDQTVMDDVHQLCDAALAAMARWQEELASLREMLQEDAEVSDEVINTAATAAVQYRKAPHDALQKRLKELTAATEALHQAQQVRLDGSDEMKLSNRFNFKKPKVTEKLAKAFCEDLALKPEGKWRNAFEYLQGLEGAGDNKAAQAKASKQKPSVALAAYLLLAEPAAWATHGPFVRERANDFDGRQDKAAALLRALAAIGSANRDVNQWLVRLALNGTPVDTLARYHAAGTALTGVSVPSAYSAKLDTLMADLTFDATVWTRLKTRATTKNLFLSSVVAFLQTEDEATACRVAEDYYGLVATARPGNTEEGRIATGLAAGVIEQSKQRTVHTTATGSGHAYKYGYIGGFVRAFWELHVHEGHANLYPAWKPVSNPREHVDDRDTYVINGALRGRLA